MNLNSCIPIICKESNSFSHTARQNHTGLYSNKSSVSTERRTMEVKDIRNLNQTDLQNLFDGIDNIVLDVDGVVWANTGQPIEGITETFKKLKKLNKNIYFASNNNLSGISQLHRRLTQFIPDLLETNVIIPTKAIISYLKSNNFNKKLYICGSPYMKQDFLDAGFVLADSDSSLEYDAKEFYKRVTKNDQDVGAVIMDVDLNLNYIKLTDMLNYLKNGDVLFLTGSNDKKIVLNGVTHIMSIGDIVPIFYEMLNRSAVCFGKPHTQFQNYLTKSLNISDPSRTLFVGDMLCADIGFGKSCGFKTLLVLTGISQLHDIKNCSIYEIPDYYIKSFGDLGNILETMGNIFKYTHL